MTSQAAIFTAGPPVVKQSTGEDISKGELGGPDVAIASGVVHNVAADDAAALDQIRRYLSASRRARSYPPTRRRPATWAAADTGVGRRRATRR